MCWNTCLSLNLMGIFSNNIYYPQKSHVPSPPASHSKYEQYDRWIDQALVCIQNKIQHPQTTAVKSVLIILSLLNAERNKETSSLPVLRVIFASWSICETSWTMLNFQNRYLRYWQHTQILIQICLLTIIMLKSSFCK